MGDNLQGTNAVIQVKVIRSAQRDKNKKEEMNIKSFK